MSSMSNYLENKLIDQLFRGQAFSFPGTLYFGLLTATPSDTGGGTEVTIGTGAYARVGVAASLTNFKSTQGDNAVSTGTNGTTMNTGAINFPTPSASWGTVGWLGIYDAATAGNLLWWGALTAPKTINNGDAAPSFAATSFTCQLDT